MKGRAVLWLMILISISAFFSCRKNATFSVETTTDSLSHYNGQLAIAKEYFIVGKIDSSIYLLHQLLNNVIELPSNKEVLQLKSQIYNVLGCNIVVNNKEEAIKLFKKACDYAIQSNYVQFLYGVYVNLADAYSQNGNVVNAICYLNKALLLSDSLNLPKKDRFLIYYGLGQAYLGLRDFKQSDYYNELAGRQYDSISFFDQYLYLTSKANNNYYKEEYQAAFLCITKARAIAENYPELSYERNICNINIADVYLKLGQLDSTEMFLLKVRPFFEQNYNPSAVYYLETLEIQLALRRGNLSQAFALLKRPIDNSLVIPDMFFIRQQSLQVYYEEVGNYQEALRCLKKNNQLNDSIRNERIANRVAEMDMRYKQDTTLLKKTLLIQRQQEEMTQWKWGVVTCVALVLASIMAILYFRKKKDYLQVKYQNRVAQLQMETIRNRIFPHFIFNTLMREIATYEEQDSHRHRLQKLLLLLKQTLRQTETLALTLREELDFVQNYVDWERFGFDGEFEFKIEMDDEIDSNVVYLLPMMIQLPVENAIKHALRGKEGKKELTVKIHQLEKQSTIIRIQDNGLGFGVQAMNGISHNTGTGLRVLTQTIQLLNSVNKEEIYFHISNLTDNSGQITGCQVEIIIPHHYSYQLKR